MTGASEVVRAAWDAYSAGDLERALRHFSPDVVWHAAPDHPGAGTYHGRAGLRAWISEIAGSFSTYMMTITDVREVGEVVLADGLLYAERDGVAVINRPTTWRCTVRDGLITSVEAEITEPATPATPVPQKRSVPPGVPALACPRCRDSVSLADGIGSVGAKVFTCRSCGYTFGPGVE